MSESQYQISLKAKKSGEENIGNQNKIGEGRGYSKIKIKS